MKAQFSGRRIEITVQARARSGRLGVAYSTNELGNSGWRTFELLPEWEDYTFEYDVPPMNLGRGDFVGFRSYGDVPVEIGSVELKLAE